MTKHLKDRMQQYFNITLTQNATDQLVNYCATNTSNAAFHIPSLQQYVIPLKTKKGLMFLCYDSVNNTIPTVYPQTDSRINAYLSNSFTSKNAAVKWSIVNSATKLKLK